MLGRMERVQVEREARGIRFGFPQPPRTGRRVASLRSIHKAYGDNVVYAGVDFEVERGMRVAFVGPNGAGKSTLLKILAGVLPFERGDRASADEEAAPEGLDRPQHARPIGLKTLGIAHLEFSNREGGQLTRRWRLSLETPGLSYRQ